LYVGLMSGTSMDSVDAVLMDFSQVRPVLLGSEKKIIPPITREKLFQLCSSFNQQGQTSEQALLEELNEQLAKQFSGITLSLLQNNSVEKNRIAAIGSHGQTVFHRPPCESAQGFSLQIGHPQYIANATG